MSHEEKAAVAHHGDGHHGHEEPHHQVGYGVFILVWLALLCLTAVTVSAAGVHLGNWNLFVALAIATVKVLLVLSFFMHLKYEGKLLKIMLVMAVLILGIILGLTFGDVSLWERAK